MYEWAAAEIVVDRIMASALNLDSQQSFLFGKVLSFHQKLRMLSVMINLTQMDEDGKEAFRVQNRGLFALEKDRNIVAHNLFSPSESGEAVEFFTVTANSGKLMAPDTKWTEKDFLDRYRKLRTIMRELKIFGMLLEKLEIRPTPWQILSGVQSGSFPNDLDLE